MVKVNHPHYRQPVQGGEIVFFCSLGNKKKMAIACIDEQIKSHAERAVFWSEVGKHPEYIKVELDFFSDAPRSLCQSPYWQGDFSHPQCQNCEIKRR